MRGQRSTGSSRVWTASGFLLAGFVAAWVSAWLWNGTGSASMSASGFAALNACSTLGSLTALCAGTLLGIRAEGLRVLLLGIYVLFAAPLLLAAYLAHVDGGGPSIGGGLAIIVGQVSIRIAGLLGLGVGVTLAYRQWKEVELSAP